MKDLKELNEIPIINGIEAITAEEIEKLLAIGLCYFKKPKQEQIESALQQLKKRALTFFNWSSEEKEKTSGYNDRRKLANPELVERLIFPIKFPPELFGQDITEISGLIQTVIADPLLEKIFAHLGQAKFTQLKLSNKAIDSNGTYVSFVCYPSQENSNVVSLGLRKHKDLGLLTVLSVTQPGLKIRTKKNAVKDWAEVKPLEDYYIIVLGKVLQLMLGKEKCNAVSHKVELTTAPRLTMGFFFNPPASEPIVNLFTDELLFDNFFPSYINMRLTKYQ
jgi:isopenicillin N synthase-like dioxygenase